MFAKYYDSLSPEELARQVRRFEVILYGRPDPEGEFDLIKQWIKQNAAPDQPVIVELQEAT